MKKFPEELITIIDGVKYKGEPKDIIKKLSQQVDDLKEDKHSYYCVIPWKILTNKTLSSSAKLLYGEISALANKEGFCWASNSYLAKIIGIKSPTRISVLIRKLKESNYIFVEVNKDEGNKRKIWIRHPINQNSNSYCSKEKEAIVQKRKKDKNNIDKNKEKKELDKKNEKKQVIAVSEKGVNITGKDVNILIDMFKSVNPSFEGLFKNRGQRAALERMIQKHGYEKIKRVLDKLPEIAKMQYAPVVTTPYQLEQKLGQLIIFLGRENNKGGGVTDARNIQ